MLQVVIDRAPLLLVGIPRPAMFPSQEPVTANLVLLPPVAERDAAGVAELRYGVGRAAAEPGVRIDGLFLCSVLYIRMVLPALFWSRISTAVPLLKRSLDE